MSFQFNPEADLESTERELGPAQNMHVQSTSRGVSKTGAQRQVDRAYRLSSPLTFYGIPCCRRLYEITYCVSRYT